MPVAQTVGMSPFSTTASGGGAFFTAVSLPLLRDLPKGLMAGAVEMVVAGGVLLIASRLNGERLDHMPQAGGLLAVAYLVVFGSIIAISAYMFLLSHARPALATSYAYVNPVVAVLLGMGFAGEHLGAVEWLALGVIVLAVAIDQWRRKKTDLS